MHNQCEEVRCKTVAAPATVTFYRLFSNLLPLSICDRKAAKKVKEARILTKIALLRREVSFCQNKIILKHFLFYSGKCDMETKKALLIIGHGSRSIDAKETFNKIVDSVKSKKVYQYVFGAHMENALPSIEEVVGQIYQEGIRKIIAVPYFLYCGIHIKEDIPEKLNLLKKQYKDIQFEMTNPLGFDELLVDLLLKRIKEIG